MKGEEGRGKEEKGERRERGRTGTEGEGEMRRRRGGKEEGEEGEETVYLPGFDGIIDRARDIVIFGECSVARGVACAMQGRLGHRVHISRQQQQGGSPFPCPMPRQGLG